jgi:hypothetical protein
LLLLLEVYNAITLATSSGDALRRISSFKEVPDEIQRVTL